jgi:tetratricopeptide (TPR) repeat protein
MFIRVHKSIFFLLLLIVITPRAVSQEESTLEWYYEQASEAIAKEYYERATRYIEEGKKKFPDSSRLNLLLADLYYDKELYKLALEEYLEAEKKGEQDFYALNQISRSYGKLNLEQESIDYLEQILSIYPDSVTTIDDLGWMYFKTHQLEKGEKIILQALEEHGADHGLFMTLGTIYSGLYNYEQAKHFYKKSIEKALEEGDDYFASIAYYNLSLLEHNFYQYNSSLRYTEESIAMADRAPGHLARGELYQSRMDFDLAHAEYQKALARDTTPLTKVNLAILYQKFGRLELARKFAEEVLHSPELSWMYYYGIDLDRHYKDIHEILADIYLGLARVEVMKPSSGLPARIKSIFKGLKYRLLAYYHKQKFKVYSLQVGQAYLAEGNLLDAYLEFFHGNESYRQIALRYLFMARDIETRLASHSEVFYYQDEAKLRRSPEMLKNSLAGFDPFWEKEAIARGLRLLIPLLPGNSEERLLAINQLYEINPGALLQHGFGLPLLLRVSFPEGQERDGRIPRFSPLLERAGSLVSVVTRNQSTPADNKYRYELWIQLEDKNNAGFRLTNISSAQIVVQGSAASTGGSAGKRAAELVQGIIEQIYELR